MSERASWLALHVGLRTGDCGWHVLGGNGVGIVCVLCLRFIHADFVCQMTVLHSYHDSSNKAQVDNFASVWFICVGALENF